MSSGVYDAHEVAYLLGGRHIEQIIRWSTADVRGNPPMVAPSLGRAFSFVDLVSLAVVAELCNRQVLEREVRRGVQMLAEHFGFDRPLAHREVVEVLATSGGAFLAKLGGGWFDIGRGGQGAFEEILKIYMRKVTYDQVGVAALWTPAPHVVLDPAIQAGAPCVEGTRIPTSTIVDLLEEQTLEEVAEEYDLTFDEVSAAQQFEARLRDGVGLAVA